MPWYSPFANVGSSHANFGSQSRYEVSDLLISVRAQEQITYMTSDIYLLLLRTSRRVCALLRALGRTHVNLKRSRIGYLGPVPKTSLLRGVRTSADMLVGTLDLILQSIRIIPTTRNRAMSFQEGTSDGHSPTYVPWERVT